MRISNPYLLAIFAAPSQPRDVAEAIDPDRPTDPVEGLSTLQHLLLLPAEPGTIVNYMCILIGMAYEEGVDADGQVGGILL